MTAQAKPSDPSMEDILSSIRRIIADDQAKAVKKDEPPPTSTARVAAPEAPAPHDDVLELTADLQAEAAPDYNQNDVDLLFREIEEEQQAIVDEELEQEVAALAAPRHEEMVQYAPPPPAAPVYAPMPQMASPAHEAMAALISPHVGASVSGAFSQLAHTVLSQNARTLDDLVQDMLKPMLKGWLDENLPTLVERLVRAEIERVARGGR